jgi:hypothetical protein
MPWLFVVYNSPHRPFSLGTLWQIIFPRRMGAPFEIESFLVMTTPICPICHIDMSALDGSYYWYHKGNHSMLWRENNRYGILEQWQFNGIIYSPEEFRRLLRLKAFW